MSVFTARAAFRAGLTTKMFLSLRAPIKLSLAPQKSSLNSKVFAIRAMSVQTKQSGKREARCIQLVSVAGTRAHCKSLEAFAKIAPRSSSTAHTSDVEAGRVGDENIV